MGVPLPYYQHETIPAAETGLDRPLDYYLIQYHDGCLEGEGLSAQLLRKALKSRAEVFETRWPGYYAADSFRPCEMNENSYFSLLVDENQAVLAGSRAIFGNASKDMPYYGNYDNRQLDATLAALEKDKQRPLRLCEYGGAFTLPAYKGDNGLSKVTADHLYKFINKKEPDIVFVDAFADLLPKYLKWAPSLGMKQMYLIPSQSEPLGMLTMQSAKSKDVFDIQSVCKKTGQQLFDGLSEHKPHQLLTDSLVKRAIRCQHQAEAGTQPFDSVSWAEGIRIKSGSRGVGV